MVRHALEDAGSAKPPPVAAPTDVAAAGRRLRRKTVLALTLTAAVPLLVLAYITERYIVPALPLAQTSRLWGIYALMFFAMLGTLAGGYVIWDLGRMVEAMSAVMASASVSGLKRRTDEMGTLMDSLARLLATVNQQAAQLNSFAERLDLANTELERSNAQLKELSFKDDVTGLYNRRFLSIRLVEELSRFRRFNHPVSIVLLDLDGFKAVNDEFGHAAGDETLRDIAQILMKHSRGINVVSRYGGDEFAILLVETSKLGATVFAERIRGAIAAHPFSHGRPITASFGIVSLPEDGVSLAEDLLRVADEALYAAKRGGKNRVTGVEPGRSSPANAQAPAPGTSASG
jgi:diguanylate cyclase (GGDEF)-like protein